MSSVTAPLSSEDRRDGCDASQGSQEFAGEQEKAKGSEDAAGSCPQATTDVGETVDTADAGAAATAAEASSKDENGSEAQGEQGKEGAAAAALPQSTEDSQCWNSHNAAQGWQGGVREQDQARGSSDVAGSDPQAAAAAGEPANTADATAAAEASPQECRRWENVAVDKPVKQQHQQQKQEGQQWSGHDDSSWQGTQTANAEASSWKGKEEDPVWQGRGADGAKWERSSWQEAQHEETSDKDSDAWHGSSHTQPTEGSAGDSDRQVEGVGEDSWGDWKASGKEDAPEAGDTWNSWEAGDWANKSEAVCWSKEDKEGNEDNQEADVGDAGSRQSTKPHVLPDEDDSWGDWDEKGKATADAEELSKLSVKELKRMLAEKDIKIPVGITEKKELVDLFIKKAAEDIAKGPTVAPGAPPSSFGTRPGFVPTTSTAGRGKGGKDRREDHGGWKKTRQGKREKHQWNEWNSWKNAGGGASGGGDGGGGWTWTAESGWQQQASEGQGDGSRPGQAFAGPWQPSTSSSASATQMPMVNQPGNSDWRQQQRPLFQPGVLPTVLPPKLASKLRASKQQGPPGPFPVSQAGLPLWPPGPAAHPPVWRAPNLNFPQQLHPTSGKRTATAPDVKIGARFRSRSRSSGRDGANRSGRSSSCSCSHSSVRSPSCGERRGGYFSRSRSHRSRRRHRDRSRSRQRRKAWYGDHQQRPERVAHVEPAVDASADQQALEQWLLDLDGGRGSLMQFMEPLQREFGSLKEVAAAYCVDGIENDSASIVSCVDPVLFEALGVTSLGHKLMFAKGVTKLAAQLEDEEKLVDAEQRPHSASHDEQRWQEEEPRHVDMPKPKWMPPATSHLSGPKPSSVPSQRVNKESPAPRPTPRGSVGAVSTKVVPTSAYKLQEISGGFMSSAETEGPKPPKCPPPPHILAKAAISKIVGLQKPSAK